MAALVPIKKPTPIIIGEFIMPKVTPGMLTFENKVAGSAPNQSRTAANTAANPIDPNTCFACVPPSSVAVSACAADSPTGYVSASSSIKRLRKSAVYTKPSAVPQSAISTTCHTSTVALEFKIQMPGIVKASPPPIMAPALMAV